MVVRGQESIGVAPLAGLATVEPYDTAKDIEFFAAPQQSETLALRAGDFAVFTPNDAHRPSLHLDGPHVSRKTVVKVSVAYSICFVTAGAILAAVVELVSEQTVTTVTETGTASW